MGHLDLISFISDGFNIYFPILICVLCAGTYMNLGQRCLSVFGFQRFIDGTGDMTSDMVDEGVQLVNRGIEVCVTGAYAVISHFLLQYEVLMLK